ncbi:MAG: type II secretion system F family protein [Candidatus Omnitrophica bacterium]|nr:type II secretion system F family protein [Candidatus Omnitrophota bacterium]
MPNFKYSARDNFAKFVSGVIAAEDQDAAAKKLQEMGYFPLNISEAHKDSSGELFQGMRRVTPQEVNAFTRQLYAVQKAALPILASLESIAQQTPNPYFKSVIESLIRDVRSGTSLSVAMAKFDRVFDGVYVSMIKAAETSGGMVEILGRLNDLLEKDIDTRSRISSATRYPMLAFFVLCAGFLIVVTFVIPRFANIYGQFHTALPLPTQILINISLIMRKFWYLIILGIAAIVFAFNRFISSVEGRLIWDNFKLKAPVFGPLMTMLTLSRFARITAILMKSGVPILEVLDLVSKATGNAVIARAIINIKESVRQGKGLSEPMKLSGLFPAAVVQMVYIGEQSGRVDELLVSVADYYDSESGYMIRNLTTYIEPILIFILSVMVLVMALAIFLPMWNLIKVFRPG